MSSERHERFEELVDRRLAGAGSLEEERALGEHLAECAGCREYLSASQRAIAGLNGFSFEAGPALNAKVMAAVRERAAEMEERRARTAHWVRMGLIAVVLTVVGSVVDLGVGRLAAGVFDLRAGAVREGLMAVWIVPSFGLLLLFPMLPWLAGNKPGKGRTI